MTSKMTSEKCNEPKYEELLVWVENFSLVGKRSTTGSSTTWTNAVSFAPLVQMLSSCKCPLREDSYAAFVPRLKSYLRSTMTQERLNHIAATSCHSEIVKKLDSNRLLDEFIKKAPVRMNVFSFHNAT